MKKVLLFSATMLVVYGSSARAQGKSSPDPKCESAAPEARDACQKAVDLFNYVMPQLGTAVAGGNATLGLGSTLGGLGHFSFGLRATAVEGHLPEFNSADSPGFSITAAEASDYKGNKAAIPMPAVDLAIGLFKGIPLGITNLGGLDLLLSAAYVPEYGEDDDDVTLRVPDGSLKLGYGARLGILQEGTLMPGLSVSYLMRGLPTIDLTAVRVDANEALNDSIYLRKLEISTASWRVVASKKLLFLGLAVGYGRDTYDASSEIGIVVRESCLLPGGICGFPATGSSSALVTVDEQYTRSNLFGNLSLGLLGLKLAGEVGQVSGGDMATFNRYFDKDGKAIPPDKTRPYASVGIRLGF